MPDILPTSSCSKVRVVHTVSAISEEASGPTYVVKRLCESLIEQDCDSTIAALDWVPLQLQPDYLKTFPLGLGPRRLGRSPEMKSWLNEEAKLHEVDVIHNHGLWMMPNIYPAHVASKYDIPLLVAPHNTLSDWSLRSGSKLKRLFWPLIQKPALAPTTCFHATAESEYMDIRKQGFKQPVAIVPNAIDIPHLPERGKSRNRTLLFLGRIHPEKGLDILLPAWCAVQDRFPDWNLRIVGSDDGFYKPSGYLVQIQHLARELGAKRVEFSGTLYGGDKWQAYRDADLFVLPSYSENFAVTVAEALVAGIPAVVSKGAPWQGLEAHEAGWWVDVGIDPLVAGLTKALATSDEKLLAMGLRGRAWMERDFSWQRIGQQMMETYRWLCDRTLPVPPWVKLD